MINENRNLFNYLRQRESGNNIGAITRQSALLQNITVKNPLKHRKLDSSNVTNNNNPSSSINVENISPNIHTHRLKAILITLSVDKCYFAVGISDNSIGIYCALYGHLVYNLLGASHNIYTIAWHPHIPNIISCSDLSGSVFLWDLAQHSPTNFDELVQTSSPSTSASTSNIPSFSYIQCWSWRPFLSLSYAIDFHPFSPIMTIARDREIRFVNWMKGHHIAVWRFYSEFSWVPWISWSYVGSSILVSVGNPHNNCMLHSIIESISQDNFSFSPVGTNCPHYNHNNLCQYCDTCPLMSQLGQPPPTFDQYQINCVDLIRFVLSRPINWFTALYICVDCCNRFRQWANSIQIHDKYTNCSNNTNNQNTSNSNPDICPDVDSSLITVIESPLAPELVWEALQCNTNQTGGDPRLSKFQVADWCQQECSAMMRCVAMFERECLRQSICWSCLQQLHKWIMNQQDFPRYLYQEMLIVRQMVIERCKHYDMHVFDQPSTSNTNTENHIQTQQTESLGEEHDGDVLDEAKDAELDSRMADVGVDQCFEDRDSGADTHSSGSGTECVAIVTSSTTSCCCSPSGGAGNGSGGGGGGGGESSPSLSQDHDDRAGYEDHDHDLDDDDDDLSDEPATKRSATSSPIAPTTALSSNPEARESSRLRYLNLTMKMLQLYISEPSRLGDIIEILLHNDISNTSVSCYPYLSVSKIDSCCIRRWSLHPLGETPQKISPRSDYSNDCSNVVVPCLVFPSGGGSSSGSSLASNTIRLSQCGRYLAVLVPCVTFNRLYCCASSPSPSSSSQMTRKRQHSMAFHSSNDDRPLSALPTNQSAAAGSVIAVYSAEPESNCGQLLHYFHWTGIYPQQFWLSSSNPSPRMSVISLDFSAMDNLLLVGVHSRTDLTPAVFPVYSSNSHTSTNHDDPHDSSTTNNEVTHRPIIGVILELEGYETCSRDLHPTKSLADKSNILAPPAFSGSTTYKPDPTNEKSPLTPQPMKIVKYLRENVSPITDEQQQHSSVPITDESAINCVVWNNSGSGILYSRTSGGLYSANYVGCTG